ncbi:2-succinyl-6-hydroxy-2,4-cyclohexadiene-1-carboxylate synthase [Budviciaceae bacterium BWR-B9]|uniref:2-succinyl-6-hydroxy-2,4-cyclohexadiene-1-carboxylate synthase n=1 Tax=Limnobaculum allomyrinae TaxID=2791986 RepID=A0ABS1IU69_9GAMM|nr:MULTISPECIES: 2-succinyl-6-hydroxy-2,4-cyclohexadiene-1-carboxylate synthase [Limnobaculum]MBK5145310.1 2-succinyl-6-hydroxy-2,4-cyclohexadiene-1-carboxylate synthase [Limnobaculum allomyrinae]MBV7693262.1 2-succinyl-6-hydroxy-2,4-cyclohexadiene-1-carboxylate synthase [Limnobaculum sp. M2-1]
MLAVTRYPSAAADNHQPWLVFLHGLLGDGQDWSSVLPYLNRWSCLTIDLPGHGKSQDISVNGFEQLGQQLAETLLACNINRYILIGYSLGGRSAMYHTCFGESDGLVGLVVEGGNPGLSSESERQARLQHDGRWAEQFRQQPLSEVLSQWYQQPVFANLSDQSRRQLILRRSHNNGDNVAHMLESTSLGCQPPLGELLNARLKQRNIPFCYLCGEQDAKFQQIALENHFPLRIVAAAGHNAHSANPDGFAAQLLTFLKEC